MLKMGLGISTGNIIIDTYLGSDAGPPNLSLRALRATYRIYDILRA